MRQQFYPNAILSVFCIDHSGSIETVYSEHRLAYANNISSLAAIQRWRGSVVIDLDLCTLLGLFGVRLFSPKLCAVIQYTDNNTDLQRDQFLYNHDTLTLP